MKKLVFLSIALCAALPLVAENITARYYGSEIDLSQKNNPCRGNTDGYVEVIVVTTVSTVKNSPGQTVVERIYSLPNGEVLKSEKEIIDSPKQEVLHKLFPREYPRTRFK